MNFIVKAAWSITCIYSTADIVAQAPFFLSAHANQHFMYNIFLRLATLRQILSYTNDTHKLNMKILVLKYEIYKKNYMHLCTDIPTTFVKHFFCFQAIVNTRILRKYELFWAEFCEKSSGSKILPDVTETRDMIGWLK